MTSMSSGAKRSIPSSSFRRGGRGPDAWKQRVRAPKPADTTATSISATLETCVFANTDNGFAIMRATADDGAPVTLKGSIAHVNVGEHVTCTGAWLESKEHGWSFQVEVVESTLPSTEVGIAKYLASNVPRIGEEWAKAIAASLGDRAFERIQQDPTCLAEVTRSGAKQSKLSSAQKKSLVEHMKAHGQDVLVVQKLARFGIHGKLQEKVRKHFGYDLGDVLDNFPYRLVEVRGVGFRTADELALANGMPRRSPERIQAGIVYCLQDAEGSGHCFLWEDQLECEVRKNLFPDHPLEEPAPELDELVDAQLAELLGTRKLMRDAREGRVRWWLPELYYTELRLAGHVRELLATKPMVDVDLPERPVDGDFIPNDGQWQAIENALGSRLSLITGLPGTGKTTLVKLLLEIIDGLDLRLDDGQVAYVLASPTGKAARRLHEATGANARTIHRLLEWAPGEGGFQRDEENPLAARFVIVDETSMVDLRLADSLLRAIGPATHLVLVGDADQLPPVGAGKVFDDLIEAGVVPSVRLTEIFRQAARSMIVRNAHRIVGGERPYKNRSEASVVLGEPVEDLDDDFFFVHREEAEDVARTIVEFAAERIPKRYGLDPMRDVLVLAPMKKGPCGLDVLNSQLQWRLNRDGRKIGIRDMRVGDRVIQTRNNYDLEVMNGEVGVLADWDAEEGIATIDFGDDRSVEVPAAQLATFMLAYAISVHRSQGSQAPAVICAVAMSHYIMLSRSLVNTAVTRAQRMCVCVGQMQAMGKAVKTVDSRTRNAALAERVTDDATPRRRGGTTLVPGSEHAEVFGAKA